MSTLIRITLSLLILFAVGCSSQPSKQRDISGLWLKTNNSGEAEGFYLDNHGGLQFYNFFNWIGNSWSVDGKSLQWLTSTEDAPAPQLSEMRFSLSGNTLNIFDEPYFHGSYTRAAMQPLCGNIHINHQGKNQRLTISLVKVSKKDPSASKQNLILSKTIFNPAEVSTFNLAIAADLVDTQQAFQLLIILTDEQNILSRSRIDYSPLPSECIKTIDLH